MNKYGLYGILFGLILGFFQPAFATVPSPNLDLYKKTLEHYHDAGLYEQDIEDISYLTIEYINRCIATNKKEKEPKKLAVVFDIDETVLSNYDFFKQNDYAFPLKTIHENQPKAADVAIKPMLDVYRTAINNNIAVFFITGRTKKVEEATIKNLKSQGYTKWNELILKPEDYHEASASIFKTNARKHIAEMGYDIIANIGDQESDLVGGYADRIIKLPNPYYHVP